MYIRLYISHVPYIDRLSLYIRWYISHVPYTDRCQCILDCTLVMCHIYRQIVIVYYIVY